VLNQSADYALRAVLFVAQGDGTRSCTAAMIAEALAVPRNYLGKVLHTLTGVGVLTSVRGPQGGFRLAVAAGELTLASVVEPFQRLPERRSCLLGSTPCDPAMPCTSHQQWQQVSDQVTTFFRTTTIERMLEGGATLAPAAALEAHGDAVPHLP
jgi:Rrf2 family transcriptional regulator, iron-sulfur cluster assembly transcription factor